MDAEYPADENSQANAAYNVVLVQLGASNVPAFEEINKIAVNLNASDRDAAVKEAEERVLAVVKEYTGFEHNELREMFEEHPIVHIPGQYSFQDFIMNIQAQLENSPLTTTWSGQISAERNNNREIGF